MSNSNPIYISAQSELVGAANGQSLTMAIDETTGNSPTPTGSPIKSITPYIRINSKIGFLCGFDLEFYDAGTSSIGSTSGGSGYASSPINFTETDKLESLIICTGIEPVHNNRVVVGISGTTNSGTSFSAGVVSRAEANGSDGGQMEKSFSSKEVNVAGMGFFGLFGYVQSSDNGNYLSALGFMVNQLPRKVVIYDVAYSLPSTVTASRPFVVGQTVLSNNSNADQVSKTTMTYESESTSSWSISTSISASLTVGTEVEVKASIPTIAEVSGKASWEVSVESSFSYTVGKVVTKKTSRSAEVCVNVPGNTSMTANMTIETGQLSGVSYTAKGIAIYADGSKSDPFDISGEYDGTSQFSLSVSYESTSI